MMARRRNPQPAVKRPSKTVRKGPSVPVTDHAVLRYLQRHCDIDVEAFRQAIAAACASGIEAGAPCVRFDGARFIIKRGWAVTTLSKDMTVSHASLTATMRDER